MEGLPPEYDFEDIEHLYKKHETDNEEENALRIDNADV